MTSLFYPVNARSAGHWVRCTLLALRFAARLPRPRSASLCLQREIENDAVRWLDLHCHLNALYQRIHHQGRPGGPRSVQ